MENEMNVKKQKIAEEYLSSLADLNVNSKPLINMLTILADENIEHADAIVKVVEQHIAKVDAEIKLPVLYLIDSIVKNVGRQYIQLFRECIVNIFVGVFDKVKENVREKMYALRQTWVEVFPAQKLYTLDVKVKCIDQNWPITAKVPAPSIHVNPKFLSSESNDSTDMQAKLLAKQRELLELQNRKLEMELEATKLRLQVQEQRLNSEITAKPPLSTPIPPLMNNAVADKIVSLPNNPNQLNVHLNKNYPFNQVRPNMRKNPAAMNNAQNNFPVLPNTNRPRVAPVNPALINSLSRRDPRLARQQQQQQQIHPKSDTNLNIDKLNESISQLKGGSIKTNEIHKGLSEEDSAISFGRKRSEERNVEDRLNNRSRLKGNNTSSNKDRRSPSKDYKSSKNNESGKSNRNDRPKDRRDREKDKKYSDRKFKDIDEKGKTKDEKNPKKGNGVLQLDSPVKSNDFPSTDRNNIRSPITSKNSSNSSPSKESKSKEKSRNENSSPNKEKSRNEKEIPEKRIKLSTSNSPTAILLNTDNTTVPLSFNASKEKMNKIHKTEQTKEDGNNIQSNAVVVAAPSVINACKDIDLRTIHTKMDIDMNPIDLNPSVMTIDRTVKPDEILASTENIEMISELRSQNITQKRASTDGFASGEPVAKKSKAEEIDQKIDILFGTEDVDLRTLPTPEVSPPPPPMISNETENWAKVKGVKPGSSEKLTIKSSLDDVRAKLAKAAKSNNYMFGKGTKKTIKKPIVEEFNDDSQDGASENIRTIISQAQELLESKSISSDQYNTLVKTAMQINETNKLKEAQRRESLSTHYEKENRNDDVLPMYSDLPPKEQRKKLPKIPKTSESKHNNGESKPMEPKKSEVTQEFNDVSAKRSNSPLEKSDDKDKESSSSGASARRRRKESKWSSMTPWEIQQQKKQSWMLQQQQQQQSGIIPPPPFPPKLLAIPPGPNGPGMQAGSHNQWQNPPSIIFGGNAIQPIAAASISNMNNSSSSHNSGNSMSGPAFSNSVNNPQDDIVRTIPIDGVSKEIRIYDDVAIVFMDWDQPREIGFQNGQRRIIIDNQDPIGLNFNDDFVNITISGSVHRIKYGFPSRELYIDANWYECYFGGPPLTIPLDGKFHVLQIEGPPPQVHIGPVRQDLVAGKINLVIDAHVVIPVFLDSRPQSFELYNKKHIIQFSDALCTALIDNEPIDVEYGGLPKSFNLSGEKHFIRFTKLPHGICPGKVQIKNMIYVKQKESFILDELKPEHDKAKVIPPLLPGISSLITAPIPLNIPAIDTISNEVDKPMPTASLLNALDTSGVATLVNTIQSSAIVPTTTAPLAASIAPALPASLNIDDLFQKLIASGILNNQAKAEEKKKEDEEQKEIHKIIPIDLKKSESVKTRQAGIVNTLFSGMQCSSCGLRFPPEQTMKYSQHLDWHFRQNRRERDSNRKAHSRKWYYDLSDWLQYEEIEDLEDREKNWFETQQVELETDENSNQKCTSPQPSCRAEAEDVDRGCEICLEKFEHFYNEELEEWHLKSAIKVNDTFYHPICYKDLQDAIAKEAKEQSEQKEKKEETKADEETECIEIDDSVVVKQEKTDNGGLGALDDDDDVIVLPNEEPSITEIPDDDDDVVAQPENEESVENITDETAITNENSSQIESASGASPNAKNTTTVSEAEKTTETTTIAKNISMEDDIVIQEPQIPFQDLDSYVEKDLSHLNEDSTQSSFANIKIKEEPKDDDEDEVIEEDDVFEDVGTVEIINDSNDSPLASPTPILELEEETNQSKSTNSTELDADPTSSANVSIDGNIRLNNLPSQILGVNKIKINIAKNIVNSSNNSNLNSNNNNINDTNENNDSNDTSNHQHEQHISTIPVITTNQSFNRREINIYNSGGSQNANATAATTTSTSSTSINNTNSNKNNNNNNNNSSNNSSSNISSNSNKSNSQQTASVTTSLLSNSNTLISIPTIDIESMVKQTKSDDQKRSMDEKTTAIEFTYKPELQNVDFKTVDKLEKGYETSGLCSIM